MRRADQLGSARLLLAAVTPRTWCGLASSRSLGDWMPALGQ